MSMRLIEYGTTFKRDYRRIERRNLRVQKLHDVVRLLACDEPLPARMRPHRLSGVWDGFLECHIEPDWLLVYDLGMGVLTLHRTGSHSDLFE